jgi:hypothetical protein
MHHTHLMLDENYVPQYDSEKAAFWEMQMFMYAVMADHLKTDKGKSLLVTMKELELCRVLTRSW